MKLQKARVSDLKPGPNIRKGVIQTEIDALAASMKEQQRHPLVVAPDHTILDGWRRWLAAQQAKLEWVWVIVTDRPLSDEERIAAQLAMDVHRKGLSEQERVAACEELAAMCPGLDQKRLAEKVQVDASTMTRWLSVSRERVIDEVRTAFFNGSIGLKAVYPISQVPKESQPELLKLALAGATREQLTTQVRRQKQPAPAIKASRVRCVLSGGASITMSGNDLSIDEVIDHLASLLRDARRAREQNLDIRTWERVMADKANAAKV